MKRQQLTTGLALLSFSAAVWCQPPTMEAKPVPAPPDAPVVVKDFDIYLDPPTGFVFVKLPQGWKFVGKVEASALAALQPLSTRVHTSLLPESRAEVEAGEARLAQGR